jgi:hypothetical protein
MEIHDLSLNIRGLAKGEHLLRSSDHLFVSRERFKSIQLILNFHKIEAKY